MNTKGDRQADNARIQGKLPKRKQQPSLAARQELQTNLFQGTIVALYTLGCFFGSLGITQVGNRFGRKKSLMIAAAVCTIGVAIQCSSTTLAQLIVGRIISGLGGGGINVMVPIWQSECTKPDNRGKNVVILGVFIASGIAIAAWINYGLSFVEESSVSWRLPLAMPGVFSLLLIAFTPVFPESPRWLVAGGHFNEAQESLRILSGVGDVEDEAVQTELKSILDAEAKKASNQRGFMDLFRPSRERLFYRMCLAVFVNFGAQFTGPAVISYYGTTLFRESLGLPGHQASLLNAGVLTWKIAAAVVPFIAVDRVGRRPLFMISAAGMSLSMTGLAVSVSQISAHSASIVATFLLFLYMTFFPVAFLGANFLYSAEIAPQDLRVYLSAVGTATHWLFNFVVAEITPLAFVTIGYRYYIVFAVFGAVVVPTVFFLFPETKGQSLEEMDRLFTSPSHWWDVPRLAAKQEEEHWDAAPVIDGEKGASASVGVVSLSEA